VKKNLFIILLLILAISSCEREDICIDDITPKFTIRFYDSEEPESLKRVSNISVEIIGVDTLYNIDNQTITASTDSIAVPLKVTEFQTQIVLTANSTSETESIADTITLNYIPEEVFVGRSCGFKSIFSDVSYNYTENWIKSIEIVTDTIDNETSAHVKIFH